MRQWARRFFGFNLRTLGTVSLAGGLLLTILLRVGVGIWSSIALLSGLAALALACFAIRAVVRYFRIRGRTIVATGVCAFLLLLLGLVVTRRVLLPWTTITGRVVYGDTSEPVAGAIVRHYATSRARSYSPRGRPENKWREFTAWWLSSGYTVQTDEDGYYRFQALPLGTYTIWLQEQGWPVVGVSLVGNRNSTTAAPDLKLVRGAIVKGRVVNADTSGPWRNDVPSPEYNIIMWLGPTQPLCGSSPIGPDGSFEARIAPGRFMMYVYGAVDDPRWPSRFFVDLADGDIVEIDLTVRRK